MAADDSSVRTDQAQTPGLCGLGCRGRDDPHWPRLTLASNQMVVSRLVSSVPELGLYQRPLRGAAVLTRGPRGQRRRLRRVGAEAGHLVLLGLQPQRGYGGGHAGVGGRHGVLVHGHGVLVGVGHGGAGHAVLRPVRHGARVERGGDGGDARHDARAVHAPHVETHRRHTENRDGVTSYPTSR